MSIATGAGKARGEFLEDLLFTHRGLSGPAVLQISSFWRAGDPLHIDLAPGEELHGRLREAKSLSRKHLGNELALVLPARLAEAFPGRAWRTSPWPRCATAICQSLAEQLKRWQLTPTGTEGYRKAEVTAGGVDTRELSSQSMESSKVPGLYFIGEVVDVTGWLGGYNFQWAWASAAACARAMGAR